MKVDLKNNLPSTPKRKQRELSLVHKKAICNLYKDRKSKFGKCTYSYLITHFEKEIGYRLPPSTVTGILKLGDTNSKLEALDADNSLYRRRSAKYPELENCLFIWNNQMESQGISVDDVLKV